MMRLSDEYETIFEQMLADTARIADGDTPLVPFWPLIGRDYDRELMVIGRSVNGWVEDRTANQLGAPTTRAEAVGYLRRDAEPVGRDRMAWVTDLWGATDGYNTRRSAFWRTVSHVVPGGPTPGWPGRIVWTNLYKVSPAAGWNPGADLQRAQRSAARALLAREIVELQPRRVLAMTGNWIDPFGFALGPTTPGALVERSVVVDGVAWVVSKHPMGKPGSRIVAEIRAAFDGLGRPIPS